MKVTSENNKQIILYGIKSLTIVFKDKTEVVLNHIRTYDLDLKANELSSITLSNALYDVEIINHFIGNKCNTIDFLHIEWNAYDLETGEIESPIFYDIPCFMKIYDLRLFALDEDSSDMNIVIKGDIY